MPEAPATILVVDDEQDVVTYLTTLFEDHGYRTLVARDGDEGLEVARREHPDLVTLDISMPRASGTKFYRAVKGDPALAAMPVVIVTAVTGFDGDPYAYEKFLRARHGVPAPEGFVPKPIDQEALLAKVRALLAARPTGGAASAQR